MKKILLATDFRNDSPGVFGYTVQLAKKLGAEIIMFHAFGTGEMWTKEETNQRGIRAINKLKSFVTTNLLVTQKEVKFNYKVSTEYPQRAIVLAVEEEKPDLVVMGIRRGVYSIDLLLGTTPLEVLMRIKSPVLIVPESFRTQEICRLGCTTDFKFRDIALIQKLREMGEKLSKNASVHCLHNVENNEDSSRVMRDMNILRSIFDDEKPPFLEVGISTGRSIFEIIAFAEKQNLDMLAMNSHQRSILGQLISFTGTTQEIARGIRVPLLVFKDL